MSNKPLEPWQGKTEIYVLPYGTTVTCTVQEGGLWVFAYYSPEQARDVAKALLESADKAESNITNAQGRVFMLDENIYPDYAKTVTHNKVKSDDN